VVCRLYMYMKLYLWVWRGGGLCLIDVYVLACASRHGPPASQPNRTPHRPNPKPRTQHMYTMNKTNPSTPKNTISYEQIGGDHQAAQPHPDQAEGEARRGGAGTCWMAICICIYVSILFKDIHIVSIHSVNVHPRDC
jgi:hypothetical protein